MQDKIQSYLSLWFLILLSFFPRFNAALAQCSFEPVSFSIPDTLHQNCMNAFSKSDVYFELIEFEMRSSSVTITNRIVIEKKNDLLKCNWKNGKHLTKRYKLDLNQTESQINRIEKGSYFFYCPNVYSSALPTVVYIKIGNEIVFSLYNEVNYELPASELQNYQSLMNYLYDQK